MTEEFLGLGQEITKCQTREFRADCESRRYQEQLLASCHCAPLYLRSHFPLEVRPSREAVEVELTDGSVVRPTCVMLGPANEDNELDTLLLLGHFGDGPSDTVRPASLSVVSDITLRGPAGPLSALGLSYDDPEDFNYLTSTVRLVARPCWEQIL